MVFSVFLPPQVAATATKATTAAASTCASPSAAVTVPVLYWLSGLTCTDQNFITKAGALRSASRLGVALVCPDTSPRGCALQGEEDSWDFGTGAGFYVNATEAPWKQHYHMYDYTTQELPSLIESNFPVNPAKQGIFGHSMGGHGALICALKNPGKYKSVSAFAPICHPTQCAWGKKAFSGYLGEDQSSWKAWDATELVQSYTGPALDILIDQGTEDGFHKKDNQLQPDAFVAAAESVDGVNVTLRYQEGYDHSYYFISSFVDDHLEHHFRILSA
eukprot:CAMPEP_0177686488 /NCGR_PEP_ID=MMETSP0447-20121125/33594_1 /TAXON_ID=0 /ORGANISM="Stygamoeba regulata, Strain BSH-02190019" /LENGTH=274 /DNA_ID=CAMNT_0019196611 /DNA_START=146 /DNA_END=970 /DNA_ORIENTATION=+